MFRIADNMYEWFYQTFTNRFTYRLMWMLDDAVCWVEGILAEEDSE